MTKLNEQTIDRTRQLAAEFRNDYQIAESLNITPRTLYDWKHKAETLGGKYARWYSAYNEGRSEFYDNLEHHCLLTIANAEPWQASAWILERCYPAKYAKPELRHLNDDDAIKAVENVIVKIREAANA